MKKSKMVSNVISSIFELRRAFCKTQRRCEECPLYIKNNGTYSACCSFVSVHTDKAAQIMNAELIEENKQDE